jgi:hypothetical protein
MGSLYLCYVDFSLVAFGNGVMTNDWWCRDKTESLLWARTHGWATWHTLVSWLIVVIHCETIPMCYLLWTFSQSDRCILSQYVAIFCPNLSSISIWWHLMNWHLSSVWELHASPPLKILIRISGRDSFKGERLWHPRCLFRVISGDLSSSRMLSKNFYFSLAYVSNYPNYSYTFHRILSFQSHQRPNLEPIKTFVSWSKCKFKIQYRLATSVQTHLFRLSIVVMLSNRCPNPLSR